MLVAKWQRKKFEICLQRKDHTTIRDVKITLVAS